MRPSRALAAALALLAALILVAACGNGDDDAGPTTAVTEAGAPPADVVREGFERLQGESYRAEVTTSSEFDASDAPPQVGQALEGASADTSGSSEAESAQRVRGTMELPQGQGEVHVVLYDGETLVSPDGEDFRALTGDLGQAFGSIAAQSAAELADNLTEVREEGTGTVEGQETRRYSGAIDPDYLAQNIDMIVGPAGLPADAISVSSADMIVDILPDGRIARVETTTDATLDLSAVAPGGTGTVGIRSVSEQTYSDHGADITVERPESEGEISTAEELGRFIAGQ